MSVTSTPACTSNEAGVVAGTKGASNPTAAHQGLFENEVSSIVSSTDPHYTGNAADAIFFFSYRQEFSVECKKGRLPGGEG